MRIGGARARSRDQLLVSRARRRPRPRSESAPSARLPGFWELWSCRVYRPNNRPVFTCAYMHVAWHGSLAARVRPASSSSSVARDPGARLLYASIGALAGLGMQQPHHHTLAALLGYVQLQALSRVAWVVYPCVLVVVFSIIRLIGVAAAWCACHALAGQSLEYLFMELPTACSM